MEGKTSRRLQRQLELLFPVQTEHNLPHIDELYELIGGVNGTDTEINDMLLKLNHIYGQFHTIPSNITLSKRELVSVIFTNTNFLSLSSLLNLKLEDFVELLKLLNTHGIDYSKFSCKQILKSEVELKKELNQAQEQWEIASTNLGIKLNQSTSPIINEYKSILATGDFDEVLATLVSTIHRKEEELGVAPTIDIKHMNGVIKDITTLQYELFEPFTDRFIDSILTEATNVVLNARNKIDSNDANDVLRSFEDATKSYKSKMAAQLQDIISTNATDIGNKLKLMNTKYHDELSKFTYFIETSTKQWLESHQDRDISGKFTSIAEKHLREMVACSKYISDKYLELISKQKMLMVRSLQKNKQLHSVSANAELDIYKVKTLTKKLKKVQYMDDVMKKNEVLANTPVASKPYAATKVSPVTFDQTNTLTTESIQKRLDELKKLREESV